MSAQTPDAIQSSTLNREMTGFIEAAGSAGLWLEDGKKQEGAAGSGEKKEEVPRFLFSVGGSSVLSIAAHRILDLMTLARKHQCDSVLLEFAASASRVQSFNRGKMPFVPWMQRSQLEDSVRRTITLRDYLLGIRKPTTQRLLTSLPNSPVEEITETLWVTVPLPKSTKILGLIINQDPGFMSTILFACIESVLPESSGDRTILIVPEGSAFPAFHCEHLGACKVGHGKCFYFFEKTA